MPTTTSPLTTPRSGFVQPAFRSVIVIRFLVTHWKPSHYINDGLSKELRASLVNKRVDREHHTSNEQGGEGESRGSHKTRHKAVFLRISFQEYASGEDHTFQIFVR
jgi:hypothetical protein